MNRTSSLPWILAVAATLVACKNDHRFETAKQVSSTLKGEWKSDCLPVSGAAASGSGSGSGSDSHTVIDLQFDGETYEEQLSVFSDQDCKVPASAQVLKGSFALGEDVDPKTAARPLDLKVNQVSLAYVGADNVDRANRATDGHCGFTDWKDGAPRDITDDSDCRQHVGAGASALFTVAKLQGDDELFLGERTDSQDGSTSDKRQTQLDDQHALKRVAAKK